MSSPLAYEGVVEGGEIRLKGNPALPDDARLIVVVTSGDAGTDVAKIHSPRFKNSADASEFEKTILEE